MNPNDGDRDMERNGTPFDPAAANGNRPKQTVRERHEKDVHALKSRAVLAFAPLPPGFDPKQLNAHMLSIGQRMRYLFGRRWWNHRRGKWNGGFKGGANGAREIARRKRRIEQGLVSPYVADCRECGGPVLVHSMRGDPVKRHELLPYTWLYAKGTVHIDGTLVGTHTGLRHAT